VSRSGKVYCRKQLAGRIEEQPAGYRFTYDLLCTSLHFPDEARTALDFFDAHETQSFRQNAFYKRPDFLQLAEIYGIKEQRAHMMLDAFALHHAKATEIISRSFLSAQAKVDLTLRLQDRLRAIAN